MIKYKALYKYDIHNLNIHFKCKSSDRNEEYITLFLLAYHNEYIDNTKLLTKQVDIDGMTSNFYRVAIYADLPINELLKTNKSEHLKLVDFDSILSYACTFALCRFIRYSFDVFPNIHLSPNLFTITTIINEEYCNDVKDLLLDIITSTLLYWDDE